MDKEFIIECLKKLSLGEIKQFAIEYVSEDKEDILSINVFQNEKTRDIETIIHQRKYVKENNNEHTKNN